MKCKVLISLIVILGLALFYWYFEYSSKQHKTIIADKNLLKEVTILTWSCDDYSELWKPHYKLLFKHWSTLKETNSFIPIMLISNEATYNDPRVISLKVGKDTTWSNNLLKALSSVKTKYVLILLDDYIVNAPVNEQRFIELLSLLEETNGAYIEIAKDDVMLSAGHEPYKKLVPGINGVIYRSSNASYRNSLQACIWNTEELTKLIDPKESAWDFELIGNKRTQKNPKPFYMIIDNPVVEYLNAVAKRAYEQDVVDYINSQGIKFHPVKLPVKTRQEMSDYLKTDEANKLVAPYSGNK